MKQGQFSQSWRLSVPRAPICARGNDRGATHENQVGAQLAAALVNARAEDDLETVLRGFSIREPRLSVAAEQGLRGEDLADDA